MIFSKEQLLSDKQAITASAASTNYIDLGATGTPYKAALALVRDIGKGQPVPFEAMVTEAFNTLTSLTIALEVDDNTSFGSATIVDSVSVLLADLAVGYNLPHLYLPVGVNERYVRMNYTVVGTDPTTGKILSGISMGRQTNDN